MAAKSDKSQFNVANFIQSLDYLSNFDVRSTDYDFFEFSKNNLQLIEYQDKYLNALKKGNFENLNKVFKNPLELIEIINNLNIINIHEREALESILTDENQSIRRELINKSASTREFYSGFCAGLAICLYQADNYLKNELSESQYKSIQGAAFNLNYSQINQRSVSFKGDDLLYLAKCNLIKLKFPLLHECFIGESVNPLKLATIVHNPNLKQELDIANKFAFLSPQISSNISNLKYIYECSKNSETQSLSALDISNYLYLFQKYGDLDFYKTLIKDSNGLAIQNIIQNVFFERENVSFIPPGPFWKNIKQIKELVDFARICNNEVTNQDFTQELLDSTTYFDHQPEKQSKIKYDIICGLFKNKESQRNFSSLSRILKSDFKNYDIRKPILDYVKINSLSQPPININQFFTTMGVEDNNQQYAIIKNSLLKMKSQTTIEEISMGSIVFELFKTLNNSSEIPNRALKHELNDCLNQNEFRRKNTIIANNFEGLNLETISNLIKDPDIFPKARNLNNVLKLIPTAINNIIKKEGDGSLKELIAEIKEQINYMEREDSAIEHGL